MTNCFKSILDWLSYSTPEKTGITLQHVLPVEPEPVPEELPPVKRRIITSVQVKNNRTGGTQRFDNETGNLCGLDWSIIKRGFMLKQSFSFDKNYWKAIALFTEHSIIDVEWRVVEVPANQLALEYAVGGTYANPNILAAQIR